MHRLGSGLANSIERVDYSPYLRCGKFFSVCVDNYLPKQLIINEIFPYIVKNFKSLLSHYTNRYKLFLKSVWPDLYRVF